MKSRQKWTFSIMLLAVAWHHSYATYWDCFCVSLTKTCLGNESAKKKSTFGSIVVLAVFLWLFELDHRSRQSQKTIGKRLASKATSRTKGCRANKSMFTPLCQARCRALIWSARFYLRCARDGIYFEWSADWYSEPRAPVHAGQDHCHLMAVVNYIISFQNSLMAAVAAAV